MPNNIPPDINSDSSAKMERVANPDAIEHTQESVWDIFRLPDAAQYQRVEDLPAEVQHRYTNVPGGFVWKEAEAIYEYYKKLLWEPGSLSRFTELRVKLETLLLNDSPTLQTHTIDHMSSAHVKHNIAYSMVHVLETLRYDLFAKMSDRILQDRMLQMKNALHDTGHEGELFTRSCGKDACYCMSGILDGQTIDVHSNAWGKIGNTELDRTESRAFFKAYAGIAIEKDAFDIIRTTLVNYSRDNHKDRHLPDYFFRWDIDKQNAFFEENQYFCELITKYLREQGDEEVLRNDQEEQLKRNRADDKYNNTISPLLPKSPAYSNDRVA